MVSSVSAMRGARRIVDECANVTADETVVVVTDWQTNDIVEYISTVADGRGADVTIVEIPPLEHHGNEPPTTLTAALFEADVIFEIVKTPMVHTNAMEEVRENGEPRLIVLPGYTVDQLESGGLFADYGAIEPSVNRMAELLTAASVARITSPQGTNVQMSLDGQSAAPVNAFALEPGSVGAPGNVEAAISPVQGSAEGTFVVDGAIPDFDIGVLEDEIVMEIVDGAVESIDGGSEAHLIEEMWNEYDTPAVYNIAQLAVGMNPACRRFTDNYPDAHGRYGNVHLGIGHSSGFLGGEQRSPIHFDAMIRQGTLELDGEVVLKDGAEFEL